MPRFRNISTGVVVNVGDDRAGRYRAGWEPLGGASSSGGSGRGDLTVEDLKDEIRARNEGRDEDDLLPLTGNKADLIAVLDADDK